jgi:hypothetical protein
MMTYPLYSVPTPIVCPSAQNEIADRGAPTSIFLTYFPSTMSKKNSRLSSPELQRSRLFTGENAMPVQTLLWAENLNLIGFVCGVDGSSGVPPFLCTATIYCKSQMQMTPF